MSNYLVKFKNQPRYFKVVFLITILPMVIFTGASLFWIISDAFDGFRGVPETGWTLVFGLPLLLASIGAYVAILFLCSRKSLVGFVASVILLAVGATALFIRIAQWTSGAKL